MLGESPQYSVFSKCGVNRPFLKAIIQVAPERNRCPLGMYHFPPGLKDKQHSNCRVSRIFQGKCDPEGSFALGTECCLATG